MSKENSEITGLKYARIHYLDPKGESDSPVDVLTSSDSVVVKQEVNKDGEISSRTFLTDIITQEDEKGKKVFIDETINNINKRLELLEENGSNNTPPSENNTSNCEPGSIILKNKEGEEVKIELLIEEV